MGQRVVLIVLDSVGIGELPDAHKFGDTGSATLQNTAKAVGGLNVPHLQRLGLGNIAEIQGVPAADEPQASFGKMAEISAGKDTTTGHWEIAGLFLDKPFPIYPNGFPPEIIEAFEKAVGRQVLGNRPASGTQIIQELGEEHIRTGRPIVYTSADSVFQIAAHEEVIPLRELYKMCETARRILTGPHAVGRVIARPFVGSPGNFTRTPNRRDFSLAPPQPTILDKLSEAGYEVCAVGKIEDIFAFRGITASKHSHGNMAVVDSTLDFMASAGSGLIFANLVDFDSLWGHRNDPAAYAKGLEEFDARVPEIQKTLRDDDMLIITADHGCDPTTESTDHSREYVPLLVYGRRLKGGVNLGIRATFADVAATIAELFGVENPGQGRSFLGEVMR